MTEAKTFSAVKKQKLSGPDAEKQKLSDPVAWPKGDLRRMLAVLVAIDRRTGQGGATLLELAKDTGLDKRSITHQIEAAGAQAGLTLSKSGPRWQISCWGDLLNREGVINVFQASNTAKPSKTSQPGKPVSSASAPRGAGLQQA